MMNTAILAISLLAPHLFPPDVRQDPPLPEKYRKYDRNGDGKLQESELPRNKRDAILKKLDRNGDRVIDGRELAVLEKKKRADISPEVRVHKDLTYATGNGYEKNLGKLDLYLPAGKNNFPVLIFIHGGGLVKGDKSSGTGIGERFALHGYGVVSINYRLSPKVMYPAHIQDVAKAFHWVHGQIEKYGGDPERISVTGGSGGGHLVALLALEERWLREVGLSTKNMRGAIPISGLVDVLRGGPGRRGTVWKDDPEELKIASPVTHVRADAPPMLIMVADGDNRSKKEMNRNLYEKLKEAGHQECDFMELKDRTHSTIRPNLEKEGDPGLLKMLEFLEKYGSR